MGKALIILGIFLITIGLLWHFDLIKHIPLGRLPGDIHIKGKNSSFYFPLTTCIVLSLLLSLIFKIFK
jgi:hypothetical protein